MQANGDSARSGSRRAFLSAAAAAAAGALLPRRARALGSASQVDIAQIVYSGGNWQPRPTALRRLAWEVHKRTSVDAALEPSHVKPTTAQLASSPLAFLCGDRPFTDWEPAHVGGLARFLRLGGTLVVDPAFTADGDAEGFADSANRLLAAAAPGSRPIPVLPGHVLFRTFYDLDRAVGRVEGPPGLTGLEVGGRLAVVRSAHDLGGAWARDNLGNWMHEVVPGGERQRELAFRLGVNIVLWALCLDYKDEEPHRRFGTGIGGG